MCRSCLKEYDAETIDPSPWVGLSQLIADYYQMGHGAGGVLHVVLDDMNVETDFIHGAPLSEQCSFEPPAVSPGKGRYRTQAEHGCFYLAEQIVQGLLQLTEGQRAAVIWAAYDLIP